MTVRPIFTDAEMDQIGDDLAVLRPDTCDVYRPSSGRDIAGAPISGQPVLVATVPCRVDASGLQGSERVTGPRYISEGRYSVALPRHTDVQNDDRIHVNGVELDVVYVTASASFFFELFAQCTHGG
jgi:hypothetical protein